MKNWREGKETIEFKKKKIGGQNNHEGGSRPIILLFTQMYRT